MIENSPLYIHTRSLLLLLLLAPFFATVARERAHTHTHPESNISPNLPSSVVDRSAYRHHYIFDLSEEGGRG